MLGVMLTNILTDLFSTGLGFIGCLN